MEDSGPGSNASSLCRLVLLSLRPSFFNQLCNFSDKPRDFFSSFPIGDFEFRPSLSSIGVIFPVLPGDVERLFLFGDSLTCLGETLPSGVFCLLPFLNQAENLLLVEGEPAGDDETSLLASLSPCSTAASKSGEDSVRCDDQGGFWSGSSVLSEFSSIFDSDRDRCEERIVPDVVGTELSRCTFSTKLETGLGELGETFSVEALLLSPLTTVTWLTSDTL